MSCPRVLEQSDHQLLHIPLREEVSPSVSLAPVATCYLGLFQGRKPKLETELLLSPSLALCVLLLPSVFIQVALAGVGLGQ